MVRSRESPISQSQSASHRQSIDSPDDAAQCYLDDEGEFNRMSEAPPPAEEEEEALAAPLPGIKGKMSALMLSKAREEDKKRVT
jgi:hypothetical protein